MKKSIVTMTVAGLVAVGGTALAVPALADDVRSSASVSTSTDGSTTDRPSPQSRITGALEGLVTEGTITQAQSEEVAATLAESLSKGGHGGPGGGGGGPMMAAAAAEALGVSEADLRTELQGGASIADVAEAQGIELDAVIASFTESATAKIAEGVEDGTLTQEQADELTANLADRITEEVTEAHDGGGRGGPRGRGPGGPAWGPGESASPSGATPSEVEPGA